jgi:hypothetical protein
VLLSDCFFFVVEESSCAEVYKSLLEIFLTQFLLVSEIVMILLNLIWRVIFTFELFLRKGWVHLD